MLRSVGCRLVCCVDLNDQSDPWRNDAMNCNGFSDVSHMIMDISYVVASIISDLLVLLLTVFVEMSVNLRNKANPRSPLVSTLVRSAWSTE